MCGIVGVIAPPSEKVERDVIGRMVQKIRHRGPDGSGIWTHNNIALGHSRLAVIDLSHGDQPMTFDKDNYVIVYNGEIYNFIEIRKLLQKEGFHFRTDSDTEVLLASYIHWGRDCLSRLNGMFSFAIYDLRENKIFLARDRLGKKPLYYGIFNNQFLFASEIKAFFPHPDFKPALSRQALLKYLVFEYVPAPDSIFSGVSKLPAGNYLYFDLKDQATFGPELYWDYDYRVQPRYGDNFELAKDRFLELFDRAVQRRLISDVPLGVFLSGGIDSSSIVALARRHVAAKELKTFSIAFQEKSYDESHYINKIAKHFHTDHYMKVLTPSQLYEVLPSLTAGMDEPLADASIIPTYLLSRFTRNYVTVALGGDGGDEFFAGYDPFLAIAPANIWRKMPSVVKRLALQCAGLLPVSDKNISLDFKINRFLRGAESLPQLRYPLWMGALAVEELPALLTDEFSRGLDLSNKAVLQPCFESFKKLTFSESLGTTGGIHFFSKIYLADDILTKVDRASMLNSLEVRCPFLDVEVVEFANSLPADFKMRRWNRKYLFKKAMENILPREILNRQKKGFGIPVSGWLKTALRPMMEEYLEPGRLKTQNIFCPHYVEKLMKEHLSGRFNHGKPLWALLIFQHWVENWLPGVDWE